MLFIIWFTAFTTMFLSTRKHSFEGSLLWLILGICFVILALVVEGGAL